MDQPLPLSQLFLCTQYLDGDLVEHPPRNAAAPEIQRPEPARKRMSFLVVHDISEHSPYAILKVPEGSTTREVIKQAVAKAGTSGLEHEYVLLEEMVVPSATGESYLTAPPTQLKLVGMDECPLNIRANWKTDSKFVLRRVGADPSWRARLGNLMIQENVEESNSSQELEDQEESTENRTEDVKNSSSEKQKSADADNFLVCVFNVSSKVSYSILQVPRTASAKDVIQMALSKSRRGDHEERNPEKLVLVEETGKHNSTLNTKSFLARTFSQSTTYD